MTEYQITPAEPITGTALMIGLELAESISDQMTADGWLAGSCPACADLHRTALTREHHADGEREKMEVMS